MALTPETAARPMASARPAPAWVAAVYAVGLVLVFIGERVLASTPTARWAATGLGALAVLATVAIRWVRVLRTTADARATERGFALLSTFGLLALVVYFAFEEPLASALGIANMPTATRKRAETVALCFECVAILFSTVPQLFGQLALEPMRLAERVEWRRVRGALATGLVVAMACASATLFTFAAGAFGLRADFSYFRTARPSDSTVKTAQGLTQPLRVITFFPPVNEVRSEVLGYLRDLARRSSTVQIEEADRLASPKLAQELSVTQDGTIVLQRGNERQTLTLPLVITDARTKLKALDSDFQKALVKVLRNRRTVYLTVGHGELNDTHAIGGAEGRTATGIKEVLEHLNYSARDLGVADGLAREVPEDATVVALLGPTEALAEKELASLERFASRGGHLLVALDAEGKANSERIAGVVGLTWKKDLLCDDRNFAARRFNDSDHAIILTNRFSSHPSVATLGRLGSRAVFFLGAGSLDKAEGAPGTHDFIARSLPSTFADKNGNFQLDADEARSTYNLAAAVSRPATGGKSDEMRAVVVADADALSDAALMNGSLANGNPQFLVDVLKWLGGEESSIGAIADTGEDVRIEHTKQKDTLLFYSTIFGAPALVLGVGMFVTRRARRTRRTS